MKKCFPWLKHPDVVKIINALSINNNPTFRFVGGCIRDSILGYLPKDFDIASLLTPENNIKLLQKLNIPVIPFALSYGTVIAKLSAHTFEITTLRIDTNTYGRHSEIKFSSNYKEDAKRRDFTINALYLNPITVEISDYFNGINDLKKGRIIFIGNINTRITEDYLRILRFIRFYTYYGKKPVDRNHLDTIKKYAAKILLLSKERVTNELNKIINHNNSVNGIKLLNKTGISSLLFQQSYLFYNKLNKLNNLANKEKINISHILKWLVLVSNTNDLLSKLNMSKKDTKFIKLVLLISNDLKLKHKISYLLARYEKNILINSILLSLINTKNITQHKYLNNLLIDIKINKPFKFCINGNDLIKLNLLPSKKLGEILLQLKEWGIENNIDNKISYLNKAKELILNN